MNIAQEKSYKILTATEKTALNLALVHNKSTWQAGEIMGKAHYKYLEISQRAQKFFKLFTEYFDQYKRLIPFQCNLAPSFRIYIRSLVEQRKELKEVVTYLINNGYDEWITPKGRDAIIISNMTYLKNSKFAEDQNLHHLLMDFDRWNNFRILPISIQEPSAFKRRNKHKLRKLVNLFTSLDPIAILKIKQLYKIKKATNGKYFYLPLYTIHDPSLKEVIKVSMNKRNFNKMNNLILYVFREKKEAERFLDIIVGYISKDYKHCKDGQEFWPEFRVLTSKALNHDIIQNITPTRKYVLDNAGKDYDFNLFMALKKKDEEKRLKLKSIK